MGFNIKKYLIFIFIIFAVPFYLFSQNRVIRPEGPMKTWSKEDFNRYIRNLEKGRRLNKTYAHEDRKFNLHSGNKIRTLFYNYGSIGRPNTEPSMEWPAFSGHGYAYEFGPIVGAEVVDVDGDTIFIFSDGMLDGGDNDPTGGSNWWGWEPLPGYAAEGQDKIAMSNSPSTWGDNFPGDDDGFLIWPGQFGDGVITADLESYFVMDDQWNAEFEYYPIPSDSTIRGIGVEVEVRGYQYAASVAEDIIFFQYKVTNVSEKTLNKVVVGMIGDPHIGGAGDFSDDFAGFIDNDGNDSFSGEQLDVKSMVYNWDKEGSGNDYGILWEELGWLGYKFLESPGVANDVLDNDKDGMTDESQYDGIDNDGDWDLTDDDAAADTAEARNWWDAKMWNGIDDDGDGRIDDWGDLDGKSDDLDGNGIPDPGEPDYELLDVDESDMIGLTSFWAPIYGTEEAGMDDIMWQRMIPGTFATGNQVVQDADNIFIFGSGYFSLEPGESQKFSIAVIMGQNKDDLLSNAKVADWIYRLGFQFTKPPEKPVVIAVPGNGKVTLYWDDTAELSVDPVNGEDFEGYKIYRSTVKGEWGQKITDNQGVNIGYIPIAQFDLVDEFEGPHVVASAEGYHMDMGNNTGLTRMYVDSNLVNGLTYFYAVTAYDKGSVDGNLPPFECSKNLGEVNVVAIIPNAPALGYEGAHISLDHYQGVSTAAVEVDIVDYINADKDIIYDIKISQSGPKKFLTITEITGEDSVMIWDQISLTDVQDIWNNQLNFGIHNLYIMDLSGVTLDSSGWIGDVEYYDIDISPFPGGVTFARDIEIKFFDDYVDSSFQVNPQPIRFQAWNVSDNELLKVIFFDNDGNREVSVGDDIIPAFLMNGTPKGIWELTFNAPDDPTWVETQPPEGSVIGMYVSKPLSLYWKIGGNAEYIDEHYRVTVSSASVDKNKIKNQMKQIAVVPNPYVAVSSFESPPPQVFTAGRGERRVDFIHLPQVCTIRIYTLAGDHIRTVEHSGTIFDGTESWNLLNKDGHEIAPGIYIYHVETPDGEEKVGRLAVIK